MKALLTTIAILLGTGGTVLQAQPVPPAALAAARSILTNLQRDFPAFVKQVHPTLGLSYYESSKSLNHDQSLSRTKLGVSWTSGKDDVDVTNDYGAEDKPEYITNAAAFLRQRSAAYPFLESDDVRYNIKGLAYSTDLFRGAAPGETLVSFHVTDPSNELGWHCLLLRLRQVSGTYFISGIGYMYWTP